MQKGSGDFDPPHLSTGKLPGLITRAVTQLDIPQRRFGPPACLAAANPVQGGVVEQVFHH